MSDVHIPPIEPVMPYHYKISIDTNLKSFVFKGNVTIFSLVKPGIKEITLNAKELQVSRAIIETAGMVQAAKIEQNAKEETLTLRVPEPLFGICKINLEFEGFNNDKMYGFYRAKYINKKGKEEYLLTTQFESTDARAAFPCFDNPSMKATFSITITADKDYEIISNMPQKDTAIIGNRKTVEFHTTPKMSTYLVYIGVGKFKHTKEIYKSIPIRALTLGNKKGQEKASLEVAKSVLSFYESYFGIKYMLPKLDLIAIPDFAAGAMENWGAITFRETAMLWDPKSDSLSSRQNISNTVAHEIAHQWFGDLVTMKWWNDLWLNESFATFMSYKSVDALFPSWKYMTQFLYETFSTAFAADDLKSTHPINVEVNSPGEIDEVFDRISYEKGGSILRMIEDFAGPETFRKGLNLYLNTHMYGNAAKEDLWDAIATISEREGKSLPIKNFAKFWIDTPGYPIVSVSKQRGGFALTQNRFLISGSAEWSPAPIPLHYITDKGKTGIFLLDSNKGFIKEPGAKWVKINYGQSGFYRASYSKPLLEDLGSAAKRGKLSSEDIWGLENDLFSLARRGSIYAKDYLDFVAKYLSDAKYPANLSIIQHLVWLYTMLYGTDLQSIIEEAIYSFSSAWLKKLGFAKRNSDTPFDILMRSSAFFSLGLIGDEKTVSYARTQFSKGRENIDSDLKPLIYRVLIANGSSKEISEFKALYLSEKSTQERIRLLQSLGFVKEKKSAIELLSFSQSGEVRLQDSIFVPILIASNPFAKSEYWPWLKKNWKAMMSKYVGVSHMLSRLVEATSSCSTEAELSDIKAFFSRKENVRDDIKRTILQSQERIQANIAFLWKNLKKPQKHRSKKVI
ncbi:MAG: M1 family metallopeptidase [Candidatus Micrarchaeia archaeon]